MRPGGGAELGVHHAGLDDGQTVVAIDPHDAIQARQHHENGAFVGEGPTRESRPGAARHERHAVCGQQPHDGDQLFARTRKNDEIRNAAMSGETVHRVCQTLSTSFPYVLLADNGGEVAG